MYRIVVTGAQDLPEPEIVWVPLWSLLHQQHALIVTYGANPAGADLFTRQWLEMPEQTFNRAPRRYEPRDGEYLVIPDPCPAAWERHGNIAGNIRNQEMIDRKEPDPSAVFAFPTPRARGTLDCMARAWVRGIPVWVWHYLVPGKYRLLDDYEGARLARRRLGWGK